MRHENLMMLSDLSKYVTNNEDISKEELKKQINGFIKDQLSFLLMHVFAIAFIVSGSEIRH